MLQSSLLLMALDSYVPPLAPLVAMAFLGTGLLLACLAVGAGVALAARRRRLAAALGLAGAGVAALYAVGLAGGAVVSRERTLTAGERKYFCEIDCHIAYEVVGAAGAGKRAVTVRTWFDPSTIAPFRGDAPLSPGPRSVFLVDGSGRRYLPSPQTTETRPAAHPDSTPFGRALRPGESYRTTFVFDVPADARSLRLFVGDPPAGLDRLVIGHENSPFHRKTYFALPAAVVTP